MAEILASNAVITQLQQYQKSHIIGNTSADESANAARLNQREVRAANKSDVEAVTQAGAQFVSSAMGLLAAPNAKKSNDPTALKELVSTVTTHYSAKEYDMASYTVEAVARHAAEDLGVVQSEFSANQKVAINNYAENRAKLESSFADDLETVANTLANAVNVSETPEALAAVVSQSVDGMLAQARTYAKGMETTVRELAKGVDGQSQLAEEQLAVVQKYSENLNQVEDTLATERKSGASVLLGLDLSSEALLKVISLTSEMCNENNKLTAHFGELMAKAANLSSKKLVDAAGVRLAGAIASAGVQVTSAWSATKQKVTALNKESASVKDNLIPKNNLQQKLSESENSILTSQSRLVAKGSDFTVDTGAGQRVNHPQQKADIMDFDMKHEQVRRDTNIAVAKADVTLAIGRGMGEIATGAFNVAAASDEADSKKLDASKELASTLSAAANKTSDTNVSNRDKLLQLLQSVISRTQDTNSVIAGNMRG